MPASRSLAATRRPVVLAALAAVILAGVFTVFRAEASGLSEVKKLTASDAQAGDVFGRSAAVSGETGIIGAVEEDAGGSNAGAAYVFQRNEGGAGNWGEVNKLTASDAQAGDAFGISVAAGGDNAIVGASGEDTGGASAGAAYVFERDQGGADNWGEVKKLTASDAEADDRFAFSVAISGDTAVVGAHLKDTGGTDAGAAYVFQSNEGGAGNWGEVKKLTASDAQADDIFGHSVAVSGDTAVVGAFAEDAEGLTAGAAYVFGPAGPVGGIAELPEVAGVPVKTPASSRSNTLPLIAATVAGAIALSGVVWYARRQRLR